MLRAIALWGSSRPQRIREGRKARPWHFDEVLQAMIQEKSAALPDMPPRSAYLAVVLVTAWSYRSIVRTYPEARRLRDIFLYRHECSNNILWSSIVDVVCFESPIEHQFGTGWMVEPKAEIVRVPESAFHSMQNSRVAWQGMFDTFSHVLRVWSESHNLSNDVVCGFA